MTKGKRRSSRDDVPYRAPVAARVVSRSNRGRRRAPRERRARTGPGERRGRIRPKPIAGAPKAQVPPAARSDVSGGDLGQRLVELVDALEAVRRVLLHAFQDDSRNLRVD